MTPTKVYEQNIHETMGSMPAQRDRRKKDYERVLTLFPSGSHARDRRNKVFIYCFVPGYEICSSVAL